MLIREDETKFYCKCDYCGKEMSDYKSNRNGNPPKYCSPECYHLASKTEPKKKKCLYCGKEILVKKHKEKKFCDIYCASAYKSEHSERKVWQGENGYRYIWDKERKIIPEHIFIMEQKIGRRLTKDEVVHHKDFNRSNNDISNLQLMSRGEHSKLHREYEKKVYGKQKGFTGGWNKGRIGGIPWNAVKVKCVENGIIYDSTGECAKAVGGNASYIWRVCKGIRKTYKGFHYEFVEDKHEQQAKGEARGA